MCCPLEFRQNRAKKAKRQWQAGSYPVDSNQEDDRVFDSQYPDLMRLRSQGTGK
jgi:hypothetical protein